MSQVVKSVKFDEKQWELVERMASHFGEKPHKYMKAAIIEQAEADAKHREDVVGANGVDARRD